VLAVRTGLSAPVLAGWLSKNPVRERLKAALKPAITVGVILPIVDLLIIIPTQMLENRTTEFGFFPSSTTLAPRWQLFLSGISAGITEEILFRLFLFTLLAWLGNRIVRTQQSGLKKSMFWIANILSALLFGLAHLSTARLDVPISVLRSIGLNSMAGLAFGWLYGFFGLESAMIAHALADILLYIVVPYFISF
jgi:membrane protease YdiL (CAAX protease family)